MENRDLGKENAQNRNLKISISGRTNMGNQPPKTNGGVRKMYNLYFEGEFGGYSTTDSEV